MNKDKKFLLALSICIIICILIFIGLIYSFVQVLITGF